MVVGPDHFVAVGTVVRRVVQTRNAERNQTTPKPRDSSRKAPAQNTNPAVTSANISARRISVASRWSLTR